MSYQGFAPSMVPLTGKAPSSHCALEYAEEVPTAGFLGFQFPECSSFLLTLPRVSAFSLEELREPPPSLYPSKQ